MYKCEQQVTNIANCTTGLVLNNVVQCS